MKKVSQFRSCVGKLRVCCAHHDAAQEVPVLTYTLTLVLLALYRQASDSLVDCFHASFASYQDS